MAEAIKLQNVVSEMVKPSATQTDATLAVSSTAVSFAAGDLSDTCKYVRLQVQSNSVRVTYDGSAPTASNGEQVQPGEKTVVSRQVALAMRFIRETSDAVVWAQPFNVLAQ